MALHYLLYESQATRLLTEVELQSLPTAARHFNAEQGLTGLLLYTTDGRFVQVLEGEAEPLTALYQRIVRDPRHQQVRLLAYAPLPARRFGDWQMGFRRLPAAALEPLQGHVDTWNALFLLPLLPTISTTLLDKLLDHVHG